MHGSSYALVNDLMPVGKENSPTQPAKLVEWWTKLEQDVLTVSSVLNMMIVRPALVYGRSNAVWSSLLQPIYDAVQSGATSVSMVAEPDARPGLVHVDVVGSGLHCAVKRLAQISGARVYPVFDLQTSQESMKDIMEAAAREFNFKGTVQLAGAGEDLFAQAMSTSQNICSGRAKTILGWEPKRFGFVGQIDISGRAWIANAKL